MPNYFDFEKEEVKKFWEERDKADKLFKKFVYITVGLFIILVILESLNKLSVDILFLTFSIFLGILFWIMEKEIQDLHNRINIIEEELSEKGAKEFFEKFKD